MGRLFRHFIGHKEREYIHSGEPVGGFTIQSDGGLLLFRTNGTVEIWKEGKITAVIDEIPAARGTRFNDAIADPKGRVFSGIMATDNIKGRLYRIDTDGSYTAVVEDMLTPNGMAFSADYTTFYLTDSDRRAIYKFDYNEDSGALSNQALHIKTPDDEGVPDGMTIDSEGFIWSARWNGSGVYRYDPDGEAVMKIELPVEKVSCVTFGGDQLTRMIISSARGDDPPEPGEPGLGQAGDIFHLESPVKGRPEMLSKILLGR